MKVGKLVLKKKYMSVSKETMKKIEGKLRRPVHIAYIARYIVKLPVDETRELLQQLIKSDIIEESGYARDFYVLKSQR
jgi:hypothetical protein